MREIRFSSFAFLLKLDIVFKNFESSKQSKRPGKERNGKQFEDLKMKIC